MSNDVRTVFVEVEAMRLLSHAGVPLEELARTLRLERDEMTQLAAAPTEMRPLERMRLALALRARAERTPDPTWSSLIADALYSSAKAMFAERVHDTLSNASAVSPAHAQAELAALLLRELGPEVFEHMDSAANAPKT